MMAGRNHQSLVSPPHYTSALTGASQCSPTTLSCLACLTPSLSGKPRSMQRLQHVHDRFGLLEKTEKEENLSSGRSILCRESDAFNQWRRVGTFRPQSKAWKCNHSTTMSYSGTELEPSDLSLERGSWRRVGTFRPQSRAWECNHSTTMSYSGTELEPSDLSLERGSVITRPPCLTPAQSWNLQTAV
ncbi:hypothetical protein RRG08_038316 [Elysia crispata]|uniref:Uncharacterized protein n=1 Tax=Elysia crispata TaxID=231223 RepID=A0AAE1APB1_9GAST|nr:hypothetical protein RRG08_038316 [Elysia crispata]